MRIRMNQFIKGHTKSVSAVRDLGCNREDFMQYLEARFYPHPITGEAMSWENYGQWHLDHIYPLAKVDPENIDRIKSAFHYTNLQPLWAEDNWSKGDKLAGSRTLP